MSENDGTFRKVQADNWPFRFGFYYSQAFDWGEKDGAGNDWDYNNPGGDKLLGGRNWWETEAPSDRIPIEMVE